MLRKSKILSFLLCFCLLFEQTGFAQVAGALDISGHLAAFRNQLIQDKFRPLHLRSLGYDNSQNNFRLLLDKGDLKNPKKPDLEITTKTLLNYFFVGVTLPNDTFWVNLRPDSENNIIDSDLATTDVGKILLEADLQLKKDTAKFTSPETPEGKEYWDKLYQKAGELLGYENMTIPTLTRPWIVPGEIIIRETKDNAYIYKATLKVMLEQDYLKDSTTYNFDDPRLKTLNEYSSQLIRDLIIPKLTKEINTSQRYAPLRQVYYSLILAQWFKSRFYGKGGLYSWLIDRRGLQGLTSKISWSKTTYFKAYQKSFKNGEYNIQQPVYTPYGQTIRSYFSGGFVCNVPMPAVPTPGVAAERTEGPTKVTAISGDAEHNPLPRTDTIVGALAVGGNTMDPSETRVTITEEASSPSGLPAGGLQSGASSVITQNKAKSLSHKGTVYGYFDPATGEIVIDLKEAKSAVRDIAPALDESDRHKVTGFVHAHEIFHQLVAKAGISLSEEEEERLANIFAKKALGIELTAEEEQILLRFSRTLTDEGIRTQLLLSYESPEFLLNLHRIGVDIYNIRLDTELGKKIPQGAKAMSIPLARLVPFLETASDVSLAEFKNRLRNNGALLDTMSTVSSNTRFIRDEITDTVEGQFSESERSVVELVSNAIDAYRRTPQGKGRVEISFEGDNGLSVSDRGEGMDLDTILTKLLIPQVSGKDQQAGIGRFGIGFYSILTFLKDPGDRIVVYTGKGEAESYRLTFSREGGELVAQLEVINETRQGTEVTVRLAQRAINKGIVQALIKDSFEFNLNSEIYFIDSHSHALKINQPEKYQQRLFGNTYLAFSSERASDGEGTIALLVSGVKIFSLKTGGFNVPQTVIISLPSSIELTIARNSVKIDGNLIHELKELCKSISVDITLSNKQKLKILSALYPLMANLQQRNDSLLGEDNLEAVIKIEAAAVAQKAAREGKIILPDTEAFLPAQNVDDVITINSELFLHVLPQSGAVQALKSSRIRIFTSIVNVFTLDFSNLGRELQENKFIFDRGSKTLFLNARHFNNPEDSLQNEEIKTLLAGPVKEVLGLKESPFETLDLVKVEQKKSQVVAAQSTKEESVARMRRLLFIRELSGLLYSALESGAQAAKGTKVGNLPEDSLVIEKSKKELGTILKECFPDLDPVFIDEAVGAFIEKLEISLRAKGMPVTQIVSPLMNFRKYHNQSRNAEWYVTDLDNMRRGVLASYQDVEDDVFEILSKRLNEDDVVSKLVWDLKRAMEAPGGLLRAYSVEMLKDDALDAFLWVEFSMLDPEIRSGLLQALHTILRSLGNYGNRDDQRLATIDYLIEIIRGMSEEAQILKSSGVGEELIRRFWEAKLSFIKANLSAADADQVTRIWNLSPVFLYDIPRFLKEDSKRSELPLVLERLIEFIGHLNTMKESDLKQGGKINDEWWHGFRLGAWHLANLDIFNRLLRTGDFILCANVLILSNELLTLQEKKIIEANRSPEEIRENIRSLLDYFLAQDSKKEFLTVMKDVHDYVSPILRKSGTKTEQKISPFWVPPSIREYFIFIFAMKPDSLAKIEGDGMADITKQEYRSTTYLSQFYKYYRMNESAQEDIAFEDILHFLLTIIATQKMSEREREVIGRRINQAVQHVSPDTYIFLREMLQNSRDAIHDNPDAARAFDVNVYSGREEENTVYVAMTDYVGMSFNILKNFLFVPGSSSKKGRGDLIGRYGTGFYTILRGAKAVLIKTCIGNGEVVYVRMTPVFKEGTTEIIDVKIELEPTREEGFRGTVIQQVRRSDFPRMVAAAVESRLISYGGIMDPTETQVRISGRQVNTAKKELASEIDTPYGPIRIYHLPGERTLTQHGLYMNLIGEDYERWLGEEGLSFIRERLLEAGLIIDLPAGLELIKDRSDIKNRSKILAEIGPMIQLAAINALINLFVKGKISLPEIPYDLFQDGSPIQIDSAIRQDAQNIADGITLDARAIQKYSADKEKITLLLISLPIYGKKSLRDVINAYLRGEITEDELPPDIKGILSDEVKSKKSREVSQKIMKVGAQFGSYSAGYLGEEEKGASDTDVPLGVAFDPSNPDHVGLEGYFALAELTSMAGFLITGTPFGAEFYARPDGSKAHASRVRNRLSWNVYALDALVKRMSDIINAPQDEMPGLYEILETIIHEIAHVRERGSTTHNAFFGEVEFENMVMLLARDQSFRAFLVELKNKYRGRLINQKNTPAFSEFLLRTAGLGVGEKGELLIPVEEKDSSRTGKSSSSSAVTKTTVKPLSHNGVTYGYFDPATGEIVIDLKEAKSAVRDIAPALDESDRHKVTGFVHAHEIFHQLVAKAGISLSEEEEERLANIFAKKALGIELTAEEEQILLRFSRTLTDEGIRTQLLLSYESPEFLLNLHRIGVDIYNIRLDTELGKKIPQGAKAMRENEDKIVRLRQDFFAGLGFKAIGFMLQLAMRDLDEQDIFERYDSEYDVAVVSNDVMPLIASIADMENGMAFNFRGTVVATASILEKAKKGDKDSLFAIRHEHRHNYYRQRHGNEEEFTTEQRLLDELYAYYSAFIDIYGEEALSEARTTMIGTGTWAQVIAGTIIKDYINGFYKKDMDDITRETLRVKLIIATFAVDALIKKYGQQMALEYLEQKANLDAILSIYNRDRLEELIKYYRTENTPDINIGDYEDLHRKYLSYRDRYSMDAAIDSGISAKENEVERKAEYRGKDQQREDANKAPEDLSRGSAGEVANSPSGQRVDTSEPAKAQTPSGQVDKKGGIDFRALPIVNQQINTGMLKLSAADLNRLNNVNLNSEWAQIQNMVNAGIIPSNERIKEYVLASCLRQNLGNQMNKVLGCIADIMRMEEDRVSDADTELKDMLVLIEAGKPETELQCGLSQIKISPQEPQLIIP